MDALIKSITADLDAMDAMVKAHAGGDKTASSKFAQKVCVHFEYYRLPRVSHVLCHRFYRFSQFRGFVQKWPQKTVFGRNWPFWSLPEIPFQ
jgi:hypothetical protein